MPIFGKHLTPWREFAIYKKSGAKPKKHRLMGMRIFILIMVLCGMLVQFNTIADPVLPESISTSSVLLQIPDKSNPQGNTFGSGICIMESNLVFFVTAAHCLFNENSTNKSELLNTNAYLQLLTMNDTNNEKTVLSFDLQNQQDFGLIKRHATHDLAVILMGSTFWDGTNNYTVSIFNTRFINRIHGPQIEGEFIRADIFMSKLDDLQLGADTYLAGYPLEILNNRFVPDFDYLNPLVRKGIVAQINKQKRLIIIDSGVYGGNSGCPVFSKEQTLTTTTIKLIGITTKFIPYVTRLETGLATNKVEVNTGYAVAEPMDYVEELFHSFETNAPAF